MKKSCLALLALSVSLITLANPVDVATANSVAQKFIQSKIKEDSKAQGLHRGQTETEVEMKLMYEPTTGQREAQYYVFAPAEADGFVIVSGEDKLAPIMGYSLTGNFSVEQMPPALKDMLSSYAQYVDDVRAGVVAPIVRMKKTIIPVSPLITTTWNQYSPYNYYCPEIDARKTLTGCVATATAQIMKYYEWPKAGHGSCTATLSDGNDTPISVTLGEEYNWGNMKSSYLSSYTETEAQAVGLLMRDVGYACSLLYGVNVTLGGATVHGALFEHFDYSSSLQHVRKEFYSGVAWSDMLCDELQAGRPVYYAASDGGGGHAFVLCGVDLNGAYYINWGWGGSSDGYFYMDDFLGYNNGPHAVIGIKPVRGDGSEEDIVAIPHLGVSDILNQNTSLSAPSVDFYLKILNGTVNPISGRVGYALFENGNMVSSEIQKFDTDCYINGMASTALGFRTLQLGFDDAAALSQGTREIRLFWQPAGSEDWFDPLGDQCLYMMTTAEGHCFSTEKVEVEVPVATVGSGVYYLRNVGTGKFLTAANDWGTRASIGDHGLDVTLTKLPNGKYTIDTQIETDKDKHFLGLVDGVYYMDAAEMEWTIGVLENGSYVLSKHNSLPVYLGVDVTWNVVNDMPSNPITDENVQWQLLTREDMMDCLSRATASDPIDATFFIVGAGFGRVDSRNGAWADDPTIGGLNSNFCAEKWNVSVYDVNQRLTGLPKGFYELRMQGFYREGGGDNSPEIATSNYAAGKSELNAILYANEEHIPLSSIMSEAQEGPVNNTYFYKTTMGYVPQSMIGASLLFNEGLYQHSLIVEVTDGTLCVGVKKNVASVNDWACFDNFELYYYGLSKPQPKPEGISSISMLDNGTLYQVLLPHHGVGVASWAIDQGGSAMKSNVDIGVEVNGDDARQQFAFISHDGGTTHYLYHPAAKKYVNKDGSLGIAPRDQVYFKDGAYENTFVVYFDDSHFVNVNGNQLLVINSWGPGSGWGSADGGNSCLIVPVGSFEFVEPEPEPGIELNSEALYHVTQPYRGGTSWAVAKDGTVMTINTKLDVAANSADARQQFMFVSNDDGKTRYLYHPAEKKYVNKDASLGVAAQDPVYFEEGMYDGTYVVYFDETHVVNTNETEGLVINRWGPFSGWGKADEGNSCVITAVEVEPEPDPEPEPEIEYTVTFYDWDDVELKTQKVKQGQAATAPDDPEREGYTFMGWDKEFTNVQADLSVYAIYIKNNVLVYTTQFDVGADGWIYGTVWHDQAQKIVKYTSPLYRAQDGKVETLRFTVSRTKGDTKYFCLSELEFYDADGNKIVLDASNVASNADHNALNPNSPDGGGFAALFDGQTETYFHSAWKNIPAEDHYLEVVLPNGGYDAFSFKMLSRAHSIDNGVMYDQSHTFPSVMAMTTSVEIVATDGPEPGPEPVPEYTVTFYDWDGAVLKIEVVNQSQSATAPADPMREGYTFKGWDKEFVNVQSDLDVYAVYTKNEVLPIKPDLDGETLYLVLQPYHELGATSWVVARGASKIQSSKELSLAPNGDDLSQQFAFVSNDGGNTRFLYHPGEKRYVNKFGLLSEEPQDPIYFAEGAYDNTFVVYFDDAHFVNINNYQVLVINDWGPGGRIGIADGGNSCLFTAIGKFDITAVDFTEQEGLQYVRKVVENGDVYIILLDGAKYSVTGVKVK